MSGGCGRVLVAGEADHLAPHAVLEALGQLEHASLQVTIAAVAGRASRLSHWAPLSGIVTLDAIHEDMLTEAGEAARRCSGSFPGHISVRHGATSCWAAALELADQYNALLVIGTPRRRRDRRAVARACVCATPA